MWASRSLTSRLVVTCRWSSSCESLGKHGWNSHFDPCLGSGDPKNSHDNRVGEQLLGLPPRSLSDERWNVFRNLNRSLVAFNQPLKPVVTWTKSTQKNGFEVFSQYCVNDFVLFKKRKCSLLLNSEYGEQLLISYLKDKALI